jgi:hypothetical protein
VDSQPPTVVRTIPANSATQITEARVEVEFSEYVDRRSVEESFFVSPYLGAMEFSWSGTEVVVTFSDSLKENTTYVVSLGTDVVDVRAGNRMSAGFTLAFSTGDSIDQGSCSGRVYDDQREGVMVFAYRLDSTRADTLDPARARPDYLMQTGTGGTFRLSNLRLGTYRLYAVRDEYRNFMYDREVDLFGVLPGDITLTDSIPAVEGLMFRLAKEDTTRPYIASATAPHSRLVHVRFNEALDSLSVPGAVFAVEETTQHRVWQIRHHYLDMRNAAVVVLVMDTPPAPSGGCRVSARDLRDLAGNPLDTLHASAAFAASTQEDTTMPGLTVPDLPDSARGVDIDIVFNLRADRFVERKPALGGFVLRDSTGRVVPVDLIPRSPAEFFLRPRHPLQSLAWYLLAVRLDSLIGPDGRHGPDSTLRIHFQTLDVRESGAVEGRIVDRQEKAGRGRVLVSAARKDLVPTKSWTIAAAPSGEFRFDRLPAGLYGIDAFRDADSSSSFTPGRPFPFAPSERFVVYPDTLRLRARWGIEGLVLTLP